MKNLGSFSSLISMAFILLTNTGCSPDSAHADSPCPSSFNSLDIRVFDSISGEEVKTAEVTISGNVFDNSTMEYAQTEVSFNYDANIGNYGFVYSSDGIEIDQEDVTIYTIDSLYGSNVTKPQNFGCTSLESKIYLCPKGTACR